MIEASFSLRRTTHSSLISGSLSMTEATDLPVLPNPTNPILMVELLAPLVRARTDTRVNAS